MLQCVWRPFFTYQPKAWMKHFSFLQTLDKTDGAPVSKGCRFCPPLAWRQVSVPFPSLKRNWGVAEIQQVALPHIEAHTPKHRKQKRPRLLVLCRTRRLQEKFAVALNRRILATLPQFWTKDRVVIMAEAWGHGSVHGHNGSTPPWTWTSREALLSLSTLSFSYAQHSTFR